MNESETRAKLIQLFGKAIVVEDKRLPKPKTSLRESKNLNT